MNKRLRTLLFLSSFLSVMLLTNVWFVAHAASTPSILSYQGRLADASGNLLGSSTGTTYYFKFSIWDTPTVGGGSRLWPTNSPSSVALPVRSGAFTTNIGDTAAGFPDVLDYDFTTSANAYLQIEVSSDNASFQTLAPRQRIGSTPFAQLSAAVRGATTSSSFGTVTPFSTSVVSIQATSTNATGLSVRAVAGQLAHLLQVQDFTGANLLTVSATGGLFASSSLQASGAVDFYSTLNVAGLTRLGQASSTLASVLDDLVVGRTASTTIRGETTATSTFAGGIQVRGLQVTTATSSFANGIDITGGCILYNGSCLTGGGGSGISSLNGLGATTQSFATSSDTNIGLTITSVGSTHTFTSQWLGTLGVARGGTGAAAFGQGWVYAAGGTGALAASTSPTVAYITATSTTATSTLPLANITTALRLGADYVTDITGSGLNITANALTLDTSGSWSGTLGAYTAAQLIAAGFSTTSADAWDATKNRWATTSSDYYLGTKSTTNLAEGSNLYYTPGRFDARLAATTSLPNITTLAGLSLPAAQLSGFGVPFYSFFAATTTDALTQGSVNKYYADSLVNTYIHGSSTIPKTYATNTFTAGQTFNSTLAITAALNCTGGQALQTDSGGVVSCGTISVGGASSGGGWTTNSIGSVTLSTTSDRIAVGASSTPYAKVSILSGNAGTTTLALLPASAQTAHILDIYNTSGALASVLTAQHYLGLGTTSPSEQLSVVGNAYVAGNVQATNITATGALTGASLSLGSALTAANGGTGINNPAAAGILVGSYTGGSWQQVATSSLGLVTTNVAEGANLYYTPERFDARLAATTSLPNITTLAGLSLPAAQLSGFGVPFYSFFAATTTDALAQGSVNKYYNDSLVNTYIHASTTIPKTYTTNTFTGANVFNGALTFGTLNGPLDARNGVVGATSSIGVLYGGTGLTTAPSYGNILVGNNNGGYTLSSTSSLNIAVSNIVGTLPISQGGTGQTGFGQGWLASDGSSLSASTSPTVAYVTATSTTATSTLPLANITTALRLGADYLTDITGSGLNITANALTLDTSGNWTGTLGTYTAAQLIAAGFSTTSADAWDATKNRWATTSSDYYLSTKSTTNVAEGTNLYYTTTRFDNRLSATTSLPNITTLAGLSLPATQLTNFGVPFYSFFAATTTDALAQGSVNKYYNDSLVNTYIHASTTIPKTYTSNTFTNANTFNGALTFGSLNGPLDARNGVVGATSSIGVLYGGTGLTSAPTYGQLLVGNNNGGYTLSSTSSLNIAVSNIVGTLPISQGGTGQTGFGQGWLASDGTTLSASTSPTVAYVTATSTTATSTLPLANITTALRFGADYLTDITGSGLNITANALTLDTSGNWTGTLGTYTAAQLIAAGFSTTSADAWDLTKNRWATTSSDYYLGTKSTTNLAEGSNLYYTTTRFDNRLSATTSLPNITTLAGLSLPATQLTSFGVPFYSFFAATTTDALTQGSVNKYYADSLVNSYIHASTTVPKTYTANTFTGAQTFNSTLTVGTLNGPLQANNGAVSATTSVGVLYGGTGVSTAPSYGNILVGNNNGGYTLSSTSSLNIAVSNIVGTLPISQGGTGQTGFGQGWLASDGSSLSASTSPTVAYVTATSTTATSTLPLANITTALRFGADYLTDITGSGLNITANALTLDTSGNWTGTLGTYTAAQLIAAGFSTTSADAWDATKNRWATTSSDYYLSTKSTTNVAEGSNLYYTTTRFDNRLSATTSLPNITTLAGLSLPATQLTSFGVPFYSFFAATTTDALTQGSVNKYYADSLVNTYIHGSSTIPKTYTTNTFTAGQTFNGALTLGALNGPIDARNGVLSSTSSIGVLYGGTGLTSAPTYGQLLVGNNNGGYTLSSTSSLNIAVSNIVGTLPISQGGTGQTGFGQGWLASDGATLSASTSPTVAYVTATSTTATSTLPLANITTALRFGADYLTDITGSGLNITANALTLDTSGNWTGTLGTYTAAQLIAAGFSTTSADAWDLTKNRWATTSSDYYLGTKSTTNLAEGSNLYYTNTRFDNRLSATTSLPNITTLAGLSLPATQLTSFGVPFYSFFAATTTDALTQGSVNKYYADSLVQSFVHSSTTIPKTYTANTFTGAQTFNSTLTVGTLNGPLQANNGAVSATSSVGVLYGGTGLTTAPSYGNILVGNNNGGYTLSSTSSLNIAVSNIVGTLPISQGGTGQTGFGQGWLASDGNTLTSSTSPTVAYVTATSTSATSTLPLANITTALRFGADYLTDLTGAGLQITGNALTLDTSGNWSGTLGGYTSTQLLAAAFSTTSADAWDLTKNRWATTSSDYYLGTKSTTNLAEGSNLYYTNTRFDNRLSATTSLPNITTLAGLSLPATQLTSFGVPFYTFFAATTTDALTQGSVNKYYADSLVNTYIHASTTIPKTYTTNTFTNANTFNGALTFGSLNGPLDARNGVVGATSSVGVLYGGTGLTSAPTYGQLLVGNNNGGYTLSSTSSLNIAVSNIVGTLPISQGGTGQTGFGQGWLASDGSSLSASTSPTVAYVTATSTTATSTLPLANITTALRFGADYLTDITGSGLNITANALTLDTSGNWTGTLGSYTAAQLIAAGFSTTSADAWDLTKNRWATTSSDYYANASTTIPKTYTANTFTGAQIFNGGLTVGSLGGVLLGTNGVVSAVATSALGLLTTNVAEGTNLYYTDARVQSFVHSSTTIPKTYTANTFTNANTFSSTLTLTGLNGPLDARNGVVGATSSVGVLYGGTGLTTAPSYGNILVGNNNGGYTLSATSSLNIATSNLVGTLGVSQGGTGATTFSQGWLYSSGGTTAFAASTSPTVAYVSATSTTASSSFPLLTVGTAFKLGTDYLTDITGSGLNITANALTLDTSGNWTGTLGTYTAAQLIAAGFSTTSADYYVHSSTTIPKTYTANTFTNGQTFNGGVTVGSLNGVLLGTNGVVSSLATSSLGLLTTDVAEGTNLYYTTTRFDNRLSATTSLPNITTLANLSLPATQLTSFGVPFYTFFAATTTDALTQGSVNKYYADSLVNTYIHGSSTIPKTYTTNTFTNANTFSSTLTLTGLNGPLDARNGVVGATSSVGVLYGGTGLTSVPTYGQLLVGNNNGGYTLSSTSSLNIATSNLVGTVGVSQGGTGATTFSQGWLYSNGGTGVLAASTSPTVAYVTATSTTATSTLPLANITTALRLGADYLTDITGSGLNITANALTLDTSGNWTGTLGNYTAAQLIAAGFSTTSADYYVHSSTTIPKTYTANTFTNANTFSSTFTLTGLNGPLDARNGVVGATSSVGVLYGGTGLTSAPTYGQLLVGNNNGGYTLTATSALGISSNSQWTTTGNDIYYNTGNVGIGSSTAWATLAVNPVAGASNQFVVGSSSATSFLINNTGLVGLNGTTTPAALLSINETAGQHAFMVGSSTATKFIIDKNGNVAIGSGSAGTNALNVTGNGNFTGSIAAGSFVYSATVAGGQSASTDLTLDSNSSATKGNVLIQPTNGNVGIGTTSPYAKLTAWADTTTGKIFEAVTTASTSALSVSATGFATTTVTGLTINGSATTTSNVGFNISAGCYAINNTCVSGGTSQWTTSGSDVYYLNGLGKVGIATSSPWATFAVNPLAGGAANQFVVGSSTATALLVNNSGYLGLNGTTTPAALLSIHETAGIPAFMVGSTTATKFIIDQNGNVAIGSGSAGTNALNVTGNGNFTGSIAAGSFVYSATVAGGQSASTDLTLDSNSSATKGNVLIQPTNGNVGIGTTSPYAKLSVNGQTVAAYFTATTSTASTFPYASTTAITIGTLNGPLQANNGAVSATTSVGVLYGGTGLTSAPTFGLLMVGNNNGGYTLTATSALGLSGVSQWTTTGTNIYYNTGNVGVGTTSPWGLISAAALSSNTGPVLTISTSTASATSTAFIVNASGRVGVATSSPTAAFAVGGDINIAAGSAYRYNGAAMIQASTTLDNYFFGRAGNLTATGISNTGVGVSSLSANTTGYENTAVGYNALRDNQGGYDNNAFGYRALVVNTSGTDNNAMGSAALANNLGGSQNNAVGSYSLNKVTSGSENTANGYNAMAYLTIGYYNTALGASAGNGTLPDNRSVIDQYMTFVGHNASRDTRIASTTEMDYGTAIGYGSRVGCSNCMALGGTGTFGTNVGIGTSTPLAKLDVVGDNNDSAPLFQLSSLVSFASTTRVLVDANGYMGLGTSTPQWHLQIASSTAPQLTLSGGIADVHWSFRNAGGTLYLSTSSPITYATTTPAALEIAGGGFGTTTVRGLNIAGQATSTSNVGYNITSGCYAINKVCIGSYTIKLAAIYATATPGTNVPVVFTGAQNSTPSFATGAPGTLTLASNVSYYVVEGWGGGGGGGATATNSGVAGGNTCFGTNSVACTSANFTAGGGSAGSPSTGGAGGTVTGGDWGIAGGAGQNGTTVTNGGRGGDSPRGGQGAQAPAAVSTKNNGASPGGGGSGGRGSTAASIGAGGGGGAYVQDVVSNTTASFYTVGSGGAGGTAGTTAGGAGAAGGIVITTYATSTINATGNDYAEMFPVSNPLIGAGDIVAVDKGVPVSMRLAEAGDKALAGIISTEPGQTLGDINAAGSRPVALSGRVPVKVNLEGGAIKAGDRITPSSQPGIGKKAGTFDDSVAIALEDFNADSSRATVMAFVNIQRGMDIAEVSSRLLNTWGMSVSTSTLAYTVTSTSTTQTNATLAMLGQLLDAREAIVARADTDGVATFSGDRIVAGLDVITPHLITDTVTTNTIAAVDSTVVVTLGDNGTFTIGSITSHIDDATSTATSTAPAIVFDAHGNATFAGALRADSINADHIQGLDIMAEQYSTLSHNVASLIASSTATTTHIYTDTITAGVIDAPIISLLMASSSALEQRVYALETATTTVPAVDIQTLLNNEHEGLTFTGPLTIHGALLVDTIGNASTTIALMGDVDVIGRPYFTSDTAGFATVQKGSRSVTITFDREYLAQPVVQATMLVQGDDEATTSTQTAAAAEAIFRQNLNFVVMRTSVHGFTILLNKPVTSDVSFNWLALAVKGAKTFVSETVEEPQPDEQATSTPPVPPAPLATPPVTPPSVPEVVPEVPPATTTVPIATSTPDTVPSVPATTEPPPAAPSPTDTTISPAVPSVSEPSTPVTPPSPEPAPEASTPSTPSTPDVPPSPPTPTDTPNDSASSSSVAPASTPAPSSDAAPSTP